MTLDEKIMGLAAEVSEGGGPTPTVYVDRRPNDQGYEAWLDASGGEPGALRKWAQKYVPADDRLIWDYVEEEEEED